MAAPADDSHSRRPMSPDQLLPPVEPPSAGFLVQLFLVPGLIVAIIVGVWLTFHWLAHLGQDPQAYVRTLRRDNEGRWQAALNLANDLRGPGGGALKADPTLAVELGRILTDESKSGRTGEQSQMLRVYLCRALGEFTISEALPPLLERAKDTTQPEVARAAIEAIAVLATNLSAAGADPSGPDVAEAVVAASRSGDVGLRSAAAFTLGVIAQKGAGPAADRLHSLSPMSTTTFATTRRWRWPASATTTASTPSRRCSPSPINRPRRRRPATMPPNRNATSGPSSF